MYSETINKFSALAEKKVEYLKSSPLAFFIGSLMAGAYVGMGILLAFAIGGNIEPSLRPLVMGSVFGIALTLITFAGAELFTGHTMYMTVGLLKKKITAPDLLIVWTVSWLGNLMGAMLLALLYSFTGGSLVDSSGNIVNEVTAIKMSKTPVQLISLGILCNWLVCLALWTTSRTSNDAAKCILIFWCLLAFIACGYEHSIANMTLFSLALFNHHPESISFVGAAYNLFWVTIGNTFAGSIIIATGYWLATPKTKTI